MKVEKSSQDLENEVIYAGLCTQCGSCNAFCPHMDFSNDTGEAFVLDQCSETVGVCYNVCPRAYLPVSEIEKKLFGQTRNDKLIGVLKEVIQVKSKNKEDILYNLVSAAFKEGIINHLVLGEPNPNSPPRNLAKVVDSARAAREFIPNKSIDNVGPLITGVGQAYLDRKDKVGLLGNPCHIQGIAKILTSDFNTGAERIMSLRLAYACFSSGVRGCKYCTDFSGEFSDITFLELGAPKSEAFLIIRSDVGQKLATAAYEQGLIEVTDRNPDLSEMQKFLNRKRKRNFKKLLGQNLIEIKYLQLTFEELKEYLEEEDILNAEEFLFDK